MIEKFSKPPVPLFSQVYTNILTGTPQQVFEWWRRGAGGGGGGLKENVLKNFFSVGGGGGGGMLVDFYLISPK